MNEIAGAMAYISQRLSQDGTLAALVTGVYRDAAPETTAFPFVTFSHISGADVYGAGADARVAVLPLFLVLAIGERIPYETLSRIANRVDALLTEETPQTVVFAGVSYQVNGSKRERAVAPPATFINGVKNERIGGYYRLFLAGA